MVSAKTHDIYVNCVPSCVSHPYSFLNDLFHSKFIHVSDQYVGSTANDRYQVGAGATVPYAVLATLSDNDILQIVHTAASAIGTGYIATEPERAGSRFDQQLAGA